MPSSAPLHIALVTDGIAPLVIGGMQTHSSELAQAILAKGHELTLVHPGGDPSLRESWMSMPNLTEVIVPFVDTDWLPGHYVRASMRYAKGACEALKSVGYRFDFIYCKGYTGCSLVSDKDFENIPIGVNMHGYEMLQPQRLSWKQVVGNWFLKKPVKELLEKADYVYSYGGMITSTLLDFGVSRTKIVEFPAAFPTYTKPKRPKKATYKLLFVGRDEPRKRLGLLEQVMKRVPPPYTLTVVGVGRPNSHNITYLGSLSDRKAFWNVMDNHDVLLVPSSAEGMPNVIMEALAAGLHVVASPVGAIPVLINYGLVQGLPVENWEFADALEQAIEEAAKLPLVNEEARSHFSFNRMVDELEGLITLQGGYDQ